MDNFDLKKYLVENRVTKQSYLNENLLQFLNIFKNATAITSIDSKDNKIVKVQKNDNPNNHLEIYQAKDYKQSPPEPIEGKYGINIVSGTIENPSKTLNSRWYNYGDKYYDFDGVLDVLKRYGIN